MIVPSGTECAPGPNEARVRRVLRSLFREYAGPFSGAFPGQIMNNRLAVLALLVAGIPTEAQPSSGIVNVPGRRTISLDGKWRAIVDPYEYGYYDFRMQPDKNGFFRNAHPKDPSDLVEYDFDTSGQLDVPGDWNTQRENLFLYEGTIWYRQVFDYQKKADTRVFLHFGAANYEAMVYLNGEKLGMHTGGFTPFAFEITEKVREKGNFVVVKVDNKRLRDAVPTVNTDRKSVV